MFEPQGILIYGFAYSKSVQKVHEVWKDLEHINFYKFENLKLFFGKRVTQLLAILSFEILELLESKTYKHSKLVRS